MSIKNSRLSQTAEQHFLSQKTSQYFYHICSMIFTSERKVGLHSPCHRLGNLYLQFLGHELAVSHYKLYCDYIVIPVFRYFFLNCFIWFSIIFLVILVLQFSRMWKFMALVPRLRVFNSFHGIHSSHQIFSLQFGLLATLIMVNTVGIWPTICTITNGNCVQC